MKKSIMMKALAGALAATLFLGGIAENAQFAMAADNAVVAEETVSGNQLEDTTETEETEENVDEIVDSQEEETISTDVVVQDDTVITTEAESAWDDFIRDEADKTIIRGLSKEGKKKTEIKVPASATKIADDAFADQSQVLQKVTFASGSKLTTIGDSAFEDLNSLTSVELPASLTMIGKEAFCKTGLTSVTIPASVTSVGERAFEDCTALAEIKFEDGCKLKSISERMFYCSSGNRELTSLVIPKSIKTIGDKAFYGFKSLTGITIPENVTAIKKNAFGSCGIQTVSINAIGLTTCEEGIFRGCSISKVDFANTMPVIPSKLFYNAGFNNAVIDIPASVTSIKEAAFMQDEFETGTNIKAINFLGSKLSTIEKEAFYGANITSIVLPTSLTSIGKSAFEECRTLTSVSIPEGVSVIDEYAFKNCKALYTVYLPKSLGKICDSKVKEDNKTYTEFPFQGCPSGLVFYVVKNSYANSWANLLSSAKVKNDKYDRRSFENNGFSFRVAYSIKYKLGEDAVNDVNNPTAYIENSTLTLKDPVRKGYKFLYWTKGKKKYYSHNGEVEIPVTTGTVVLKAKWGIPDTDYIIEYEYENDVTCKVKASKRRYNIGKNVTLPTPKKLGYKFAGWYNGDTKIKKIKKGVYYGGDLKLVAHWTPQTYTIVFDGNGATSGTMEDFVCTYDKEMELPANKFKKDGYVFSCWKYTEYKSEEKVTVMDEAVVKNVRPKGTVVFTAKWIEK